MVRPLKNRTVLVSERDRIYVDNGWQYCVDKKTDKYYLFFAYELGGKTGGMLIRKTQTIGGYKIYDLHLMDGPRPLTSETTYLFKMADSFKPVTCLDNFEEFSKRFQVEGIFVKDVENVIS